LLAKAQPAIDFGDFGIGLEVDVLSLETRTQLPSHFPGNTAAAKGRLRPDIDEIGVTDSIRKHPRDSDDARTIPGDRDRETVLK